MKELIKKLAKNQTELKKARKTGTIPEHDCYTFHKLPEETREKILSSHQAAEEVQRQKAIITAALNVYHEMRGSEYRHNYSGDYDNTFFEYWTHYRDKYIPQPVTE